MRSSVEPVDPTRVKVSVVVEHKELRPAIDRTIRRLSQEIRVPGFRQGKVPRQVMEARLGRTAIMADAIENEIVPEFYARAVEEQKLKPLGRAQVNHEPHEDGQPLEFSAVVEIRPELDLPSHRGVKVERPAMAVTDEHIDQQLDRMRDGVAQLEAVDRPVQPGDFVRVDLRTTRHEDEVAEFTQQDLLYEVGSQLVVPELDAELLGKKQGDILRLDVQLPQGAGELAGQDVTMSVLVKEAKAKVLPELNDDFAAEESEFDTLEELRADVRSRLEEMATQQNASELETRVLTEFLEQAEVPLPQAMVAEELQYRIARLQERLQQAQLQLDRYLEITGSTREQLQADLEAQSQRAVRAQLVLETVAAAEGLEATQEEVDTEIVRYAERLGQDLDQVRTLFTGPRAEVVHGDILRSKALALMVEHAELVDANPEAVTAETDGESTPVASAATSTPATGTSTTPAQVDDAPEPAAKPASSAKKTTRNTTDEQPAAEKKSTAKKPAAKKPAAKRKPAAAATSESAPAESAPAGDGPDAPAATTEAKE